MIPQANKPKVAISILNWNGWQDTLECLESVRQLDYPNYLTVVVDNGSTNGSADKIKAWAEANLGPGHVLADYSRGAALAGGDPGTENALDRASSPSRMVLIRNEENLGFTGGNNVAIHCALRRGADYVFLLNNDAAPEPSCLSQLVAVDAEADAGMVGAMVLDGEGQRVLFGGRAPLLRQFFSPLVNWHLPPPEGHNGFWDSFLLPGTAMLLRSDVLQALARRHGEYFDQSLFMYGESIVLSSRARKAGYRGLFAGAARVRHMGGTGSGGARSSLTFYYPTRNAIRTARELLPPWWGALFYLTNTPVCLTRAARHALAGRAHTGWAVLQGLIDGYRGVGGKWKRHDEEVQRHAAS